MDRHSAVRDSAAADARRFQAALRARPIAGKPRATRASADWARPMQYDESGFPIPAPTVPSFADRVRRLLFSD